MLNTPERSVLGNMSPAISINQSVDLEDVDRKLFASRRPPYEWNHMKIDEANAKAAYNELVRLEARPSRHIREEFAYHTWTYKPGVAEHEGVVEWYDAEADTLDHADEASLMPYHWKMERNLFQGQLQQWKEFRKAQATFKEDHYLRNRFLARSTMFPALKSRDSVLTQKLTTLHDWRAYRAYALGKITHQDSCRTADRDQISQLKKTFSRLWDFSQKFEARPKLTQKIIHLKIHHKAWSVEKGLLGRINAEILRILEETVDELFTRDPALLVELEQDSEETAQYLAEKLGDLCGFKWPLRPPSASLSALDKLYQWEREISRLSDLYQEWKNNLEWLRINHDANDDNAAYVLPLEPNVIRARSLWKLHVQSRQKQLSDARNWQTCWKDVEDFCEKDFGAPLVQGLSNCYPEGTQKEQCAAFFSIQEAAMALKTAEQEAAEALTILNQSKELPECPQGTPSMLGNAKIGRKRKANDEAPMEPHAKRICLPGEVSAEDKVSRPRHQPVPSAKPTSISRITKRVRRASPTPKPSLSTAVKLEDDELPWDGSAADKVDVPLYQALSPATPEPANSAPPPTKRVYSASHVPEPSVPIAGKIEDEQIQLVTKKPDRGKQAAQTSKNGKGITTKSTKDTGKAAVTKTGRVTKPKDHRAEAKANGGVRRSERVKEMEKNLRCRQGCTETHERQY